jgi:hypothetical protein
VITGAQPWPNHQSRSQIKADSGLSMVIWGLSILNDEIVWHFLWNRNDHQIISNLTVRQMLYLRICLVLFCLDMFGPKRLCQVSCWRKRRASSKTALWLPKSSRPRDGGRGV